MDELKTMSHQVLYLIWQIAQAGGELKDDEIAIANAMREHPEYAEVWDQLDELSGAEIERDGVNPVFHVQMHALVENQIAQDEPAEVNKTLVELIRQGTPRHEAIHRIAGVAVEEIYEMMKNRRNFNETRYVRRLRKLAR